MTHRRCQWTRVARLAAASLSFIALFAWGAPPSEPPAPNEFIVHLREGADAGVTLTHARRLRPGVGLIAVDADPRLRRNRTDSGADNADRWRRLHEAMDQWRARPDVRLVEPNYYGRFEAVPDAPAPNDPQFASQWWLPAVGALGLWPIGQGRGVKVALVDSGVEFTHRDLAANIESDGYNFGDGNSDPSDKLGHGTEVAGVLAALANNNVGVAGIAPQVRVLPIKVNVANWNNPSQSTVGEAVDYAVVKGARVINLSIEFDQATDYLRQRIQAALDRGVAVVAAAGNSGGTVKFPANMPGVIAVAATDVNGAATYNVGPEIAIAAPGVNILTTALGGGYSSPSGTSLAAPMVAGALAALMSINDSLPVATLVSLLKSAAAPVPTQAFGRLQAGSAAANLLPALLLPAANWTAQQSFEARYRLPPLVAPTDLYVAVTTPVGEYSLLPDCSFASVATGGYQPFARGYSAAAAASGVLFGSTGICAPVALSGLPGGTYTWRVAATTSAGGLIGAVNSEALQVAP